jgi:hypothetical protein
VIPRSLSTDLLETLKTSIEARFLEEGLTISMSEYSFIEPATNGYYGSINVDCHPEESKNLDYLSEKYQITVEIRVKKDTGFDALASIYDLRQFLIKYFYKEVRKNGLTIGQGTYLQGLTYKGQRSPLFVGQQSKFMGQCVMIFEWFLPIA